MREVLCYSTESSLYIIQSLREKKENKAVDKGLSILQTAVHAVNQIYPRFHPAVAVNRGCGQLFRKSVNRCLRSATGLRCSHHKI